MGKILLVDDDSGTCESLSDMFEENGYNVTIAGTGKEAIEKMKVGRFGIAILDVRLPDMLGTDLITPLKESNPDIVTIMISCQVSSEETIQALNEGASAFMAKPLEMEMLLLTVGEAFAKLKLKCENREAEKTQQETNTKHSAMIENIGDVIAILGADGITKYQSPNIERWFGWSSENIIGKSCWEFVHPEDVERIKIVFFEILKKDKASTIEFRFRCKDCNYKWIELTAVNRISEPEINGVLINYHDITERKQVDKELQRSELQYRNQANFLDVVIENSPFAMQVMDVNGVIIRVNQALREIMHLTDEMIVGKYNVLHDENIDSQGFMPVVKAVFNDLKSARFIMFWTGSKAGDVDLSIADEHWIDVSMFPITDEAGKLMNVVCQYVDITERKRAENTLKETNTRHTAMIENIGDVIAIIGADGIAKYQSPNIEKWFGWRSEDLIGKNGFELLHLEDVERIQKAFFEVLETGNTSTVEYRFKCKDDTYKWIEVTAVNRINEPAINGVLLNYHDITERKQSEEAMSKILHSLQQAETIADLGYFERNWQTGDGYWSEGFHRLLGVSPDDVDCKHEEFMTYVHVDDRERVTKHIQESLAKRLEMDVEFRIVRADGPIVMVHGVGRNFYDEQGKMLSTIGTFQDITGRKKMEVEKLTMAAQLQQAQKLESIGTLASGVAHEINNPLTGMINYADIIQDEVQDVELKKYATSIISEGKRMGEIVQNLLSFACQDNQKHSHARIADIINVCYSLTAAVLRKHQITFIQEIPENLPPVICRSQQIQQVILNLLTNATYALNYKYEGYHDNKIIRIIVRLFEKDNIQWIRITVEDQGIGIPKDILSRIFDPFFSTKDRTKGTGLGLSVSYGIVNEHHGEISVESEVGKFTRFHVDLRVNDEWPLKRSKEKEEQ